jgi:hypothetical protein
LADLDLRLVPLRVADDDPALVLVVRHSALPLSRE